MSLGCPLPEVRRLYRRLWRSTFSAMRTRVPPVRPLLAAGFVLSLGVSACLQNRPTQPDAAAAIAESKARLEGNWTLRQFVPERPLEPALDALLRAQFGVLGVEIRGEQLVARSGGLYAVRRLDIVESNGQRFRAQLRDDQGMTYELVGEFGIDRLEFTSLNDPWRGRGELARAQ
jgi:hypothetical protein